MSNRSFQAPRYRQPQPPQPQISSCALWMTGKCNLKCGYCFYDQHLKKDMDADTLEHLVRWLNINRVPSIGFYGGEPLMHKVGVKTVLAKTNARSYGMTTNGTLLDEDIFEWLKLFNVGIVLSFDGTKETQDRQRSNSYDAIVENLDLWKLLNVNVATTVTDPDHLYENTEHVKELGFRNTFLNFLNPYGYSYEEDKIEKLKQEYIRAVKDLHDPPDFNMNCFTRFLSLHENYKVKGAWGGCGINRRGYCVGPYGYIYPCHRSVEIGQEAVIGSVRRGIDPVREETVRRDSGKRSEKCLDCPYGLKCLPCPVSCYQMHGKFGVEPEEWFCKAQNTRFEAVETLIQEGYGRKQRPTSDNAFIC